MADKKKIKGNYAYKCECGKLIEIDDECKGFFSGHDVGDKISLLIGECLECARTFTLSRDAIGKTVFPLYNGKFEVHWKND